VAVLYSTVVRIRSACVAAVKLSVVTPPPTAAVLSRTSVETIRRVPPPRSWWRVEVEHAPADALALEEVSRGDVLIVLPLVAALMAAWILLNRQPCSPWGARVNEYNDLTLAGAAGQGYNE
jgi:hypothetical protein